MNLTKAQLGYIAGLIDGEGCIQIVRATIHSGKKWTKQYHQARILVTNTDYRMMKWLKDTIGFGNVLERKRNINKPQWSNVFIYSVTAGKARDLLLAVYDYLVIKREQADLVIQFCKTVKPQKNNGCGCKGLSFETITFRESLRNRIKFLNRRGKFSSLKNNGCELGETLTGNADGNPEPSIISSDMKACVETNGQPTKVMI